MDGARLWLVRHGETDWNALGRVQGHTRTELNATGWRQAQGLAERFANHQFAAIWSSDLPRALQTAEVIATTLGLPVHTSETLRERGFGNFEGMTNAQVRQARIDLGLKITGDLTDWNGMPGVESAVDVWKRASGTLCELARTNAGKDVLVVTHGGVIARVVYRVLGIGEDMPRRFTLANGILAVLQWRDEAFYLLSLADLQLVNGEKQSADTSAVKQLE